MSRSVTALSFLALSMAIHSGCSQPGGRKDESPPPEPTRSARPWTRWWWFASTIETKDVARQLDWLARNGFGGVEIAFVYPEGGDASVSRPAWLSPEWTEIVSFAKRHADGLGLGCDFTFGTLWPFGDGGVPPEDGALVFGQATSPASMKYTWEHPTPGRVVNHLDRGALRRYAARLGKAFAPALAGSRSGLFCDSWEVETRWIWTGGLDRRFEERYGYDLRPIIPRLLEPENRDALHDYFKLVSEHVLREFYAPFTEICHELGATSRAQCGGAPADLLSAFALVDIPESEAILYEPVFSRIPASAAALSSKPLVSSETFTCIYGWKGWPGPGPRQGEEQVADLKLVCDALFAHGVNQIVWHGMPFQKEGRASRFYATVHVGPDSAFAAEIPAFNAYMEKVSRALRRGKAFSDVAVYLPLEDAWSAGEYPPALRFPWVWGQYELRHVRPPRELEGRQPLWVNGDFLRKAVWRDGRLAIGDASFSALHVDVESMDLEALSAIHDLARQGLPVCLARDPREPGRRKHPEHAAFVNGLRSLPNVRREPAEVLPGKPLLAGDDLPEAWCRAEDDALTVFFANPDCRGIRYPLAYGQSLRENDLERAVTIHAFGRDVPVRLVFRPYQSILLRIERDGTVVFEDIEFQPRVPARGG